MKLAKAHQTVKIQVLERDKFLLALRPLSCKTNFS